MYLTFWINAFIPKEITGYTKVINNGLFTGQTAVPFPDIARVFPKNTFKPRHAGYLTDQRGFSTDPKASVRMQSKAIFDLVNLEILPQPPKDRHRTSGTVEVDIDTGQETARANANMTRCKFSPATVPMAAYSAMLGGGGLAMRKPRHKWVEGETTCLEYRVIGAASDPLVQMAADIDYIGLLSLRINAAQKRVDFSFDGKVDSFPAFEAYVNYGGITKTLFQKAPPTGNTVLNLVGGASNPVSGQTQFRL